MNQINLTTNQVVVNGLSLKTSSERQLMYMTAKTNVSVRIHLKQLMSITLEKTVTTRLLELWQAQSVLFLQLQQALLTL